MRKKDIISLEHEVEGREITAGETETPRTRDELKEAERLAKEISLEQQRLNDNVEDLSQAEKDEVFNDLLREKGMTDEQIPLLREALAANPQLPIGDIIALGMQVLSESVARVSLEFKLGDLIPMEMVKNGLKRKFYNDLLKVDHRTAYKKEDYTFDPIHNPQRAVAVDEIWNVFDDIHVGFSILDPALNQNTRDVALFIAVFNSVEWNVIKPLAVYFYRMRLRMITNSIDYEKSPIDKKNGDAWEINPVDISTLPVDITIDGENDYDALEKLFSEIGGLEQPSRSNLPTRYNPKGFTQNMMIQLNLSDYVWIAPIAWEKHQEVIMKSGRFHEKYLNNKPNILALNYEKAFGEFNGDTNYKTTYAEADLWLVPRNGSQIIAQYNGSRTQENLNLTTITHHWTRVGVFFDRTKPIFHVKFKSAGGDGSQDKVGDLGTLTTNSRGSAVDAINEVNQKATDNASNIATNITHIGDLDKLTTTAKSSVVEATNEVNAKVAA